MKRNSETIHEWLVQIGKVNTKNNNKEKLNIKSRKMGQENICATNTGQVLISLK